MEDYALVPQPREAAHQPLLDWPQGPWAPLGEPVASVLTLHLSAGDTDTGTASYWMTLSKNISKTKFIVIQMYF